MRLSADILGKCTLLQLSQKKKGKGSTHQINNCVMLKNYVACGVAINIIP